MVWYAQRSIPNYEKNMHYVAMIIDSLLTNNRLLSYIQYLYLLAANQNRIKPINPVTLVNTK